VILACLIPRNVVRFGAEEVLAVVNNGDSIGARLANLRKKKGLSQKELAAALRVSPSTIGMYERNRRRPDTETLQRLAGFFNVTADYLLGYPGPDVKSQEMLADSRFAHLLRRVADLDEEGKESTAAHWAASLAVIERQRQALSDGRRRSR